MLEHRRPDVVLVLKEKRFLHLLEMACAFDSLVEEREKEKADKYEELAADMAVHQPGYKVRIVPIVIGDLGSIGGLAKSLQTLNIFNPRQLSAVLSAMQLRVLYWSTRMKRHLAG